MLKGFNDLASVAPEIASEWHPSRNEGLGPDQVTVGSKVRVWWNCRLDHQWEAPVFTRSAGHGCPVCTGKVVLEGFNDLLSQRSDLAQEWNLERNSEFSPGAVTVSSAKKFWWRCRQGHEWRAAVSNRSSGSGCPVCARER